MKWIILIGDDNLNLDLLRHIHYKGHYKISDINAEKFVLDYGKEYVSFENADDVIDDYEIGELDMIPFKIPHFIMMSYSSREMMEEIIMQDNFIREVYVDEDKVGGDIVKIDEFIKAIRT